MADLLYTAVLEKFAGEQFDEAFDFDGFIPESTSVVSTVITAISTTGVDITADVVVSSSISGDIVTVTLRAGTEERAYFVKVVATSSSNIPSVQVKLFNITAPGIFR
jgi:hypothetical protein